MDSLIDVSNFPILTSIDINLVNNARLLTIFGVNGGEVILATNDDQVYCYGRNHKGGLGLGHDQENKMEELQLNLTLSGKRVVDITRGFDHFIALTADGQLYAWGYNQFGQLGITRSETTFTPTLIEALAEEAIISVCCGAVHTLALTSYGEVFSFGTNRSGQLGDETRGWRAKPMKIEFKEKVVSISCGKNHSLVLTESGRVFGWGLNKHGQLGQDPKNQFVVYKPELIPTLEMIIFSKAICGPNYSLLLTTDGFVYVFGENSCGQIGNGLVDNLFIPFKVNEDIRFKDIVSHKEIDTSMAVSSDDKLFIWGLINQRRQLTPKEITPSKSLVNVYAMYAKNKITFETIVMDDGSDKWKRCQLTDDNRAKIMTESSDDLSPVCHSSETRRMKTLDDFIDVTNFPIIYWTLFHPKMRIQIRMIRVFGKTANKVIFATNSDKVYGYGFNRDLTLGLGTSEERIRKPTLNRFLSFKKLNDISNGFEHCLGLTADGKCYAWGQNKYGQLGIANTMNTSTPQLVESLSDVFITQICCGSYHSMALTSDGDLFSWGHNTFSQLGDKTYNSRESPVQVLISDKIVWISSGNNHSLALTQSGQIYMWGINESGQLGRNPDSDLRDGRDKRMSSRPRLVSGLQNCVIKKAICGANYVLLLTKDGFVYGFGDNNCGQIGNNSTKDQFIPIRLNESKIKIKDIATHFINNISIGVSETNKCYVWGFVNNGNVLRPKVVPESPDKLFDIFAKYSPNKTTFDTIIVNNIEDMVFNEPDHQNFESEFTFIDITNDNQLNDVEEAKNTFDEIIDINMFPILNSAPTLLQNSIKNSIRLLHVLGQNGSKVIYITNEDKAYVFGDNTDGCLGLDSKEKSIPKPTINEFLSELQLVDIVCGREHCIGLTANGQCYGWGQNQFGQLGIGKVWYSLVPKLIQGLSNKAVVQISCGAHHTMALTKDGKVWSWGHNEFGQLGNRSYSNALVPQHISIKHKISSISCGLNHSLALIEFGLIYIWGNNHFGQLGRKPEFDYKPRRRTYVSFYPCPSNIFKNVQFIKAVCGANHTILLTREGNVYAFGDNRCGQLGDGSVGQQHQPIRINGDIVFKNIFTHFSNELSIGVSIDDQIYFWGLADNNKVISPKLIANRGQNAIFNTYAKYAKNINTFKSVVIGEETDRIKQMAKSIDIKEKDESADDRNSVSERHSLISGSSSIRTSATDSISANIFGDCMKNSFNTQNVSDLKFVSEDKQKVINCHKTIIQLRNPKFWREIGPKVSKNKEVEISEQSYEYFYTFLQFLYGIEPEIAPQFAQELRSMAKIFEEPELEYLCDQQIREVEEKVTETNICSLYKKAVDQCLSDLEKSCVEFAANNWKNICKSDAFKALEDKYCKQLILSVYKTY